mmetsp:Transcript_43447/g.93079  ORF Transcript_43447/g.93079 Transcript_43447/m.93079 type:complete len:644 (-) Transcript_43447:596-2527(-)
MKFGKSIGTQQGVHSELHYVDYKLLKKRIKDTSASQQADSLEKALSNNNAFEEELAAEIKLVNNCFSMRQQDLLAQIAALSEELYNIPGQSSSSSSWQPSCSAEEESGSMPSSLTPLTRRPAAFRTLVRILQEVDQLRKYAVWNAVAVVKILKKRRKQTNFGSEDMAAERSGWLARQNFFSGSDFAELHVAIESLGNALVMAELAPGPSSVECKSSAGEDLQQCPICLDTISDMVELTCKHRFCWKCFVLGPIAHQPGEYRISQCPICRQNSSTSASLGPADGGIAESVEASVAHQGGEGILMPSTDGLLARFLRTYFPQEAESIHQGIMAAEADDMKDRCEGEDVDIFEESQEVRDVVGELVKALLTGSQQQQSDFFDTLPRSNQKEKELAAAAQKLQWVQLASTGDPLACDGMALCVLCSEPLLMEVVVTTPCKHHFHKVCISRIDMPQCPLCSAQLPFDWFLPEDHPCTERGFRVVPANRYCPEFPGGPSAGTCGYPLHRPPPAELLARGGITMKSYLHRILPTRDADPESPNNSPLLRSPALGPSSPGSVSGLGGDRLASGGGCGAESSDSSSDESGSEEGDMETQGGLLTSSGHRSRGKQWLYGPNGRMRSVPHPPSHLAATLANVSAQVFPSALPVA